MLTVLATVLPTVDAPTQNLIWIGVLGGVLAGLTLAATIAGGARGLTIMFCVIAPAALISIVAYAAQQNSVNNKRSNVVVAASETHWQIDWADTAKFALYSDNTFTAPAQVNGTWTECTLTLLNTTSEVLVLCGDNTTEPPLRDQ